MENQRKNWRAEFFLKKKLENREPSREKNFAVEKFCDKKKTQTWGAPPRLPRRRCGILRGVGRPATAEIRGRRSGKVRGPGRPGNPPSPLKTTAPPAWEVGPHQRLHRWREREGEMDGGPRRRMAAPPPASWASPPLAWGDPETRSRSHGGGQRRRKEKQ